jgi:hypothetical protein
MRTLTQLYGGPAALDNPSFTDILFHAAYPSGTQAVAIRMRDKSTEIFTPYTEKWKTRLATALSNELEAGKTAPEIVTIVPWMSKDEYNELLGLIDSYIEGDSQEIFALRIIDLNFYLTVLKQEALQLFSAMMQQQKSMIITPFSNPDATPKLLGSGGQIITS